MDSNNTVNTKTTTELDIRDVANYLLSKIWIIALVVLCFAIIAFLWTTFFVTREYTSTTEMFVINASASGKEGSTSTNNKDGAQSTSDWSIGKQLTKTSSDLIMGDYCDYVADALNHADPNKPISEEDAKSAYANLAKNLVEKGILDKKSSFAETFKYDLSNGQITGDYIRSCLKVDSDDETCIVTVTATTTNKYLSAAISNAVLLLFQDFVNDFMGVDTIVATVSKSGSVPQSHSNANATKNAVIFAVIGAVMICAVLVIIFIFDDKIKTPDDIERQLGLSVLGTIPEIDEA